MAKKKELTIDQQVKHHAINVAREHVVENPGVGGLASVTKWFVTRATIHALTLRLRKLRKKSKKAKKVKK